MSRSPSFTHAVLFCASVVLSVAAVAHADDKDRAREAFMDGVKAMQAGDNTKALRDFQRSHRLHPHPATLLNIGTVLVQLERFAGAIEAYERYLDEAPDSSEFASERRKAKRLIRRLNRRVPRARLHIAGLVEGDTVLVDGVAIPREQLGVDLRLDPGRHRVTIRRHSRELVSEGFELRERQEVTVHLEAPSGPGTGPPVTGSPEVAARGSAVPALSTNATNLSDARRGSESGPQDEAHGPAFYETWWFWGSAAGVVATVLVVALVAGSGETSPTQGNVGPMGTLP